MTEQIGAAGASPNDTPARVLAAGIITVDQIFSVDELPTGGGKFSASSVAQVGGGVAANAAVTVARLGGRCALVGCVGTDRVGDDAIGELAADGVDVSGVRRVQGASTPISAVMVDRQGERMVVNHVPPTLFADAHPVGCDEVDATDAVVVDCRWPAAAIATLETARRVGVPGVVDVDRPLTDDAEPILQLASHLVFSEDALCATARIEEVVLALRTMRSRTSAWVAVTRGADGVDWLDSEGLRHRPAFQLDVVDTLGAGDVFHGAFTLALAEGRTEEDAIRFASAAAGLKCTRAGGRAGIPDRHEVEQLAASEEGALC